MKTSSSKLIAAFAAGFCLTIGAVQTANAQDFILTYDFSDGGSPSLFFNGAEVDIQFFTDITATEWGPAAGLDPPDGSGLGNFAANVTQPISTGFGLHSAVFSETDADGAGGGLGNAISATFDLAPGKIVTFSQVAYDLRSTKGLTEANDDTDEGAGIGGGGPAIESVLSLNGTAISAVVDTSTSSTWTVFNIFNFGGSVAAMTDLTSTGNPHEFEFAFGTADGAADAQFGLDNFTLYGTIVPEPSAILGSLFGIGMIGIVGYRRRFGKQTA